MLQKHFGTKDSVRCSEFRGGRFSEVANVLQVWDFQSVTRTLSALGVCPLLKVSAQGGSTVYAQGFTTGTACRYVCPGAHYRYCMQTCAQWLTTGTACRHVPSGSLQVLHADMCAQGLTTGTANMCPVVRYRCTVGHCRC